MEVEIPERDPLHPEKPHPSEGFAVTVTTSFEV
jgi:hypothetical protein